jgi:hypothetical protein
MLFFEEMVFPLLFAKQSLFFAILIEGVGGVAQE